MTNGVPVALALAGGSLALSRLERYQFVAIALAGLAGVMQVFALLAHLSGVDTFYGSVLTPNPATPVGLLFVSLGYVFRIWATHALRKPRPMCHTSFMHRCAV